MPEPEIYVLDEPSSNLDGEAIAELSEIIQSWKMQGKTVVISEHRLYYLKGIADRYLYMKEGTIIQDYSSAQFEAMSDAERYALGLRTMTTYRIDAALLARSANRETSDPAAARNEFALKNFIFSYKNDDEILHIDGALIPSHAITAIVGRNGAGKSTFARCLCGLEKKSGEIIMNGQTLTAADRLNVCYEVMQDVNHQLFTDSVDEEIRISMPQEEDAAIDEILHQFDLYELKDLHPMSLSGGQKQRVRLPRLSPPTRSF